MFQKRRDDAVILRLKEHVEAIVVREHGYGRLQTRLRAVRRSAERELPLRART